MTPLFHIVPVFPALAMSCKVTEYQAVSAFVSSLDNIGGMENAGWYACVNVGLP